MARRVGFWIAWYVPLVILWLAFVDTLDPAEVALGLVAAAVAATAAELVRSQDLVRFRLDPRWLRDVHRLPWQVLRDCWLLAVGLWRHCTGRPLRGTFRVVPFPSEADHARSARVLATRSAPTMTPATRSGTLANERVPILLNICRSRSASAGSSSTDVNVTHSPRSMRVTVHGYWSMGIAGETGSRPGRR